MSKEGRGQLSEGDRKRIFKALVEAQDNKMPVDKSRALVAAQFHITESQLKAIEQEGVERTWPPLGRQSGLVHRHTSVRRR